MTWSDFTVQYYDGSNWVDVDNVTELTCTVGRRKATDVWSPSSATFTVRYPNGFVSPLTDVTIDTNIRWFKPGASTTLDDPDWTGVIRDVAVAWGIPYANNVGNADVLTIYAEGHLAQWGRVQGNGLSVSANDVEQAISNVAINLGLRTTFSGSRDINLPATTVDGSALDWLNQVANTAQARIIDGDVSGATGRPPQIWFSYFAPIATLDIEFTDSPTVATDRKYDVLTFDSVADNYYTEVIVTSPGLADQTESIGAAPFRTLTVNTYANTTAYMDDIAELLLAQYDEPVVSVSQLSAQSEAQTATSDVLWENVFYALPLYKLNIEFRGSTIYAQIEGATLTASPSGARVTYFLSAQRLYSWLILDDAVYGKLDSNRLYL